MKAHTRIVYGVAIQLDCTEAEPSSRTRRPSSSAWTADRCATTRAQEQKSAGNSIDSVREREKVGRRREDEPRMQSRATNNRMATGEKERETEMEREKSFDPDYIRGGVSPDTKHVSLPDRNLALAAFGSNALANREWFLDA